MSESLREYLGLVVELLPDVQHVVRCSTKVDVLRQKWKERSLLFPAHCVGSIQLDLGLRNSSVLKISWERCQAYTLQVCPSPSSATVTLNSSVCWCPESSRCFGSLKVMS